MNPGEYTLIDREDGRQLYIGSYDECQEAQKGFRAEGYKTRILSYDEIVRLDKILMAESIIGEPITIKPLKAKENETPTYRRAIGKPYQKRSQCEESRSL